VQASDQSWNSIFFGIRHIQDRPEEQFFPEVWKQNQPLQQHPDLLQRLSYQEFYFE
jgi:hypothetical protein